MHIYSDNSYNVFDTYKYFVLVVYRIYSTRIHITYLFYCSYNIFSTYNFFILIVCKFCSTVMYYTKYIISIKNINKNLMVQSEFNFNMWFMIYIFLVSVHIELADVITYSPNITVRSGLLLQRSKDQEIQVSQLLAILWTHELISSLNSWDSGDLQTLRFDSKWKWSSHANPRRGSFQWRSQDQNLPMAKLYK
jgi:hypothetical protein